MKAQFFLLILAALTLPCMTVLADDATTTQQIQQILASHGFTGVIGNSDEDAVTPADYSVGLASLLKAVSETTQLRDFSKVFEIDFSNTTLNSTTVEDDGGILMEFPVQDPPESWIPLLSSAPTQETVFQNYTVQDALDRQARLKTALGSLYPAQTDAEKFLCSTDWTQQPTQINSIPLTSCLHNGGTPNPSGNYQEIMTCNTRGNYPIQTVTWERDYEANAVKAQSIRVIGPGSDLNPMNLFTSSYDGNCGYSEGQVWIYNYKKGVASERLFLNHRAIVDQDVYIKRDIFPLPKIYSADSANGQKSLADATAISKRTDRVLVTIFDQGVDYNHPDLAYHMIRKADGTIEGWDFLYDDNEPYDYTTNSEAEKYRIFYHGSHVAGIAAKGSDDIAILPVRLPYSIGDDKDTKAIEYAAKFGSKIVNISEGTDIQWNWTTLMTAIQQHPDMLFVIASGNDGRNIEAQPTYPASASYPNMIVVGASDPTKNNTMATFSNWSTKYVQLLAPGVDILSDIPEDQTGMLSGTSMAAPAVSNVAAKMLFINPALTPVQLIQMLTSSVTVMPELQDKVSSSGVLNESAALALAKQSLQR